MQSVEQSAYTAGHLVAELVEEWDGRDGQLAAAREYLAELEADPETDELTIMEARQAVLQRKRSLLLAVAGAR
jgi:hypothetical protein